MKLTSIIIKKLIREELNAVLETTAGSTKRLKLGRGFCKKYEDQELYDGRDLHGEYWNAPDKAEFFRTLNDEQVAYLMCTSNRFSFAVFADELESRGYSEEDITQEI